MKRLFIIALILIACKKGTSQEYDLALYGIFYNFASGASSSLIFVALYDVKNSQVISDASIYINDKKLDYYHPFYQTSYTYIPKQQYNLRIIYNNIDEEVLFRTIETPNSFFIIDPPDLDTINLNQDLVVKWKVDSLYSKNHDYNFVVFFEDKSKNPTLVYSSDFLPKSTDSILIPGYYISTPGSRYEVRIFLVNYQILDKFKPYPGYRFSFIATGQVVIGVYYTKP